MTQTKAIPAILLGLIFSPVSMAEPLAPQHAATQQPIEQIAVIEEDDELCWVAPEWRDGAL
jgi:hypothetical protein